MSNGHNTWPAKAASILKAEWPKGTPARTIAERIVKATGFHVTRNSILGKAHRLNLGKHAGASRPAPPKLDLTVPTGCRWIYGDPLHRPIRWCDKPVTTHENSSWCPDHWSRVFDGKPEDRKKTGRPFNTTPPALQVLNRFGA